jgi:hypothetical protein
MTKNQRQIGKFADAILSVCDTGEQNGVSNKDMIETLESTIEMLREWEREQKAKNKRRNPKAE